MTNAPVQGSRLVGFLAAGSGLAVASNYYAQPLLPLFAQHFGVGTVQAGLVVTLSQLGYIVGLIFLVPLGDRLERRGLLTITSALTALALLAMGLSPNFHVLVAMAVLAGLTSVTAQIIVPLSAHLAAPERRGRTVSTVMSGLLLGILLARTAAGAIAEVGGWRAVYLVAACLMAGFAGLCRRWLPRIEPTAQGSYIALLGSIIQLFREEPVLRRRGLMGALSYGAFGAFWTSMAFMLGSRHGFSEGIIGLFALVGAVGAICARFAGRLADAGWARLSTGGFLVLSASSWWLLHAGESSLVAFAAGIVLFDLGIQGAHISNQSEVYRLRPDARSRLTTCYMSCYFSGGAVGSGLSAVLYHAHGWTGACVLGAVMGGLAVVVWAATELRWPLATMQRHTA
jgi:predicted MFS family arabinose efflux permease